MATKKVILDGNTIIDLSDTTATADKVASGYKFYDANGNATYGNATLGTNDNDIRWAGNGNINLFLALGNNENPWDLSVSQGVEGLIINGYQLINLINNNRLVLESDIRYFDTTMYGSLSMDNKNYNCTLTDQTCCYVRWEKDAKVYFLYSPITITITDENGSTIEDLSLIKEDDQFIVNFYSTEPAQELRDEFISEVGEEAYYGQFTVENLQKWVLILRKKG